MLISGFVDVSLSLLHACLLAHHVSIKGPVSWPRYSDFIPFSDICVFCSHCPRLGVMELLHNLHPNTLFSLSLFLCLLPVPAAHRHRRLIVFLFLFFLLPLLLLLVILVLSNFPAVSILCSMCHFDNLECCVSLIFLYIQRSLGVFAPTFHHLSRGGAQRRNRSPQDSRRSLRRESLLRSSSQKGEKLSPSIQE